MKGECQRDSLALSPSAGHATELKITHTSCRRGAEEGSGGQEEGRGASSIVQGEREREDGGINRR